MSPQSDERPQVQPEQVEARPVHQHSQEGGGHRADDVHLQGSGVRGQLTAHNTPCTLHVHYMNISRGSHQRVDEIGFLGLVAILVHEEEHGQGNEGEDGDVVGHTHSKDEPQP